MSDKHQKITTGFVVQTYQGPKCVEQEFIAGEVEYEDDNGETIEIDTSKEEYQPFHMVQPAFPFEIAKVLTLSTAHIPGQETLDVIGEQDLPISYDTDYGRLIILPSHLCDGEGDDFDEAKRLMFEACGDIVLTIALVAADLGCWAINFDRDGIVYDRFATFEWE